MRCQVLVIDHGGRVVDYAWRSDNKGACEAFDVPYSDRLVPRASNYFVSALYQHSNLIHSGNGMFTRQTERNICYQDDREGNVPHNRRSPNYCEAGV